jgi:hypothetical protein
LNPPLGREKQWQIKNRFVTTSICGWKHLFAEQKYAQIIFTRR